MIIRLVRLRTGSNHRFDTFDTRAGLRSRRPSRLLVWRHPPSMGPDHCGTLLGFVHGGHLDSKSSKKSSCCYNCYPKTILFNRFHLQYKRFSFWCLSWGLYSRMVICFNLFISWLHSRRACFHSPTMILQFESNSVVWLSNYFSKWLADGLLVIRS